jgi:predicted O-methyltransferase YrrM
MNPKLAALLQELESFGKANDARETERARRMMNITHDTGEFLVLLTRAVDARRVLEIGTSNGYSTLWLAYAVQPLNGKVITVEHSAYKAELARENFKRVALEEWIYLHLGDAGEFLKTQDDSSFGLIFLDASRKQYVAWWADLQRVLVPGGLLVADNAVSHAHEIELFKQIVQQTPGYVTSLVPIGNGELVILKEAYYG